MSTATLSFGETTREPVLLRLGRTRLTLLHIDYVVITMWFWVTATPFKHDELLLYPMALYFVFAFFRDRSRTWPVLKRGWILLAVPTWVLVSALWSPEPFQALKSGVFIVLSMLICMFMAARLNIRSLMTLIMLSTIIVIFHNSPKIVAEYSTWGFTTGGHASKNAFGIDMAVLWVTAFSVLVAPGVSYNIRGIALCSLPVSFVLTLASQSATAILLSIGMAGMVILSVVLMGSKKNTLSNLSILIICSFVFLIAVSIFVFVNFAPVNVIDAILGAFGKSRDLTGRTDLWAIALDEIQERPLLGTGAKGYWIHADNITVRQIYIDFHKKSYAVFHFHNSWLEIGVNLGLVGVGLAFAGLSWALAVAVRRALNPGGTLNWALLAVASAVVLRSMTEAALFSHFVRLDMILWTGVLIVMSSGPHVVSHAHPVTRLR